MRSLRLALILLILMPVHSALAHKVIASVYASGDVIEGEIGFSNGDMAPNELVEVFDEDGNKLGETKTDEEGFFTFRPTKPVAHLFKSNLGSGHVATVRMEAEELPDIAGAEPVAADTATATETKTDSASSAQEGAADETVTQAQLKLITKAVQKQIIPLRRDIDAYKEKNDIQNVLGGIGYIFGLFGLGFYIAARRKMTGA
ncbi:cobalt ABC transporter permease [Methyloceanibacter sp. wino2]|uniref:cobalt ABC transporter permease n=1 Tax=Methyloceanibacter sp. wino2 TaxID=2170729 RepID=UPI000D3E1B9A|nr:cobalt ABC transporter permease [Methyloceanibacter sp. wino2]